MRVDLTDSEFRILNFVGTMRYHITSSACAEQLQDKTQNPLDVVINGVIGEYIVAKGLDLFFDLNCDLRKWGEDLKTKKGKTIDVKATWKKDGPLNCRLSKKWKSSDFYVLVELDDAGGDIVGWIRKNDLFKTENEVDIGNGPYYSVSQDKLERKFSVQE
jgi:hypothetical protein